MDPIVLSLTLCLLARPESCRSVVLGDDFASPISCMMAGEQAASEWLRHHPGWEFKGWRCGREEQSS